MAHGKIMSFGLVDESQTETHSYPNVTQLIKSRAISKVFAYSSTM